MAKSCTQDGDRSASEATAIYPYLCKGEINQERPQLRFEDVPKKNMACRKTDRRSDSKLLATEQYGELL